MKNNKHRAEVIEILENGMKAAVKFYCGVKRGDRIECVNHNGTTPGGERIEFSIGQTGTIDYVRTVNGYAWAFSPADGKETV